MQIQRRVKDAQANNLNAYSLWEDNTNSQQFFNHVEKYFLELRCLLNLPN